MEAIGSGRRRGDAGASSSGLVYGGRDPEAPSLERIILGRRLDLLDLMWAPGPGDALFEGSQKPVWPLMRGVPMAQPPLGPRDKGKRPMRPLSGVYDFALRPFIHPVYVLDIQRSYASADRYFCNIAQPRDAMGWCASYETYDEAVAYGHMGSEHRLAQMSTREPGYPADAPAPKHPLDIPAKAAPLAARAAPPAGPKVAAPLSVFTPEEATRRLKALRRDLPAQSTLVWGAYKGAHLFAVVDAPRARRTWAWRDTSPARTHLIYHAALLEGWEAPCKAEILGSGALPPTEPGQSTTVRTHATSHAFWLLELAIADDGTQVATINERRAALVKSAFA